MEGLFYVNDSLKDLMYDELRHHCAAKGIVCSTGTQCMPLCIKVHCAHSPNSGVGGFLPAVKQIANVAALPGIVGVRPWLCGVRSEEYKHNFLYNYTKIYIFYNYVQTTQWMVYCYV